MIEYYNYIKALHLIFVITWFAGLFYIPRLFVYHIEAAQKSAPEKEILVKQLKLMTHRLWFIITWPSAILASVFAFWLLCLMPAWLQHDWMVIKLGFVVLLYAYHLKCHQLYKQLQRDVISWSSNQMRFWNEGSTILLFSVVFLVIVRHAVHWVFGVAGIVGLSVLLMLGIRGYKRIREKE